MGFKEILKAELSFRQMPVKELAVRSGVQKRAIDNYLNKQSSLPSADAAVKIARILGVSVEYLVTGESAAPPTMEPDAELRAHLQLVKQLSARDRQILYALARNLKSIDITEQPGL